MGGIRVIGWDSDATLVYRAYAVGQNNSKALLGGSRGRRTQKGSFDDRLPDIFDALTMDAGQAAPMPTREEVLVKRAVLLPEG